jgi:hypothetical protein
MSSELTCADAPNLQFHCGLVPYLGRRLCWALPVAVRRSEGLDADDQLVGIHTGGNLAGNVSTIEALTRISPWLCTALRLCFFPMLRPAVYLTQKLTRPRKGQPLSGG